MNPGMSFYGSMPDSYNLIVNTEHPVVKRVLAVASTALKDELAPVAAEISDKETQIKPLEDEKYKAKAGEFEPAKAEQLESLQADVKALKEKEAAAVRTHAAQDKTLRQLIDLALLEGQMLRGEALAKFIRRSTELLG